MNPSITIIASGQNLNESQIGSALGAIPELKLQTGGPERGVVTGAVKAVKWVAEFVGGSNKLADFLIGQATKAEPGASIKIQVEGRVVEVNNVNRAQVIAVLDRAAEIAAKQGQL